MTVWAIVGPPGVGKGTFLNTLKAVLKDGLKCVSFGDRCRQLVKVEDPFMMEVVDTMKRTQLGSLQRENLTLQRNLYVTAQLIEREFTGSLPNMVILDNFPRSIPELQFLAEHNIDVRCIMLDIYDHEAVHYVERISRRKRGDNARLRIQEYLLSTRHSMNDMIETERNSIRIEVSADASPE
ncbi:hypothetical protein SARC_09695, partial [Sphaeroforma arctica JP610]